MVPLADAASLATLITAISTLVGVVGALLLNISNRGRLSEVHEAVNGQGERREARNNQLAHALADAGVAIPPPDQPADAH